MWHLLNILHSQSYHVYMCVYVHVHIYLYKVAKTHRMPYLDRLFSAKKPCNWWLFCRKLTCNLGHPMGLRHPVYKFRYEYMCLYLTYSECSTVFTTLMYVYVYIHIHMYLCWPHLCICICIRIYLYILAYIYIYMHIYTCIFTYIFTHIRDIFWMSRNVNNSFDSFHSKCYIPEIHQVEKLKFLGTNSSQSKSSFWICTARHWEI